MANSLLTNPIVLDTVQGTTAKNTGGNTYTNRYHIQAIVWDNPATTATDTVLLKDGNGNVIFAQTVASQKGPLIFPHNPFVVEDFQLTTLAEGKLYIYLDAVAQ